MNHKRIELSTGIIDIYDNAVPLKMRLNAEDYLFNCPYHLGWADRTRQHPHLHSQINQTHPQIFGILDNITETRPFMERVNTKGKKLDCNKVIANLSTSSSVHISHAHPEPLVILYYANTEWKEDWAGETMFFDENGEVEFTSRYVPGRILMFDGSSPHTIRAQSVAGPHYRFTVSFFWEEENAQETTR